MKIDKTRTPDDVYANLPEDGGLTASVLRELILETLPDVREKLSWGAPFCFGRQSICYVWPASVPWGKLTEGVALGFTKADRLDHAGYLTRTEGSRLGRHIFSATEDIEVDRVQELLRQAWVVDYMTA